MSFRRTRPPAFCLLLSTAALAACGGRTPELSYHVTIPDSDRGHAEVELEIRGASGGALTLRGFASREVLRLSDLRAEGEDGRPLETRAGFDTIQSGAATVDIPRFEVAGPLPPRVRVRWRVEPGNREGDSHVGYTGRCHGAAGERFALLSGRNLFLAPEPAEKLRSIEVRFSLPADWQASVPWERRSDHWRPGLGGGYAAEHLVTASIGLGSFRERSFEVRGTRHRLAFERGTRPEEEERAASLIESTVRYVGELFGRGLGPEYLTVVAPRAPSGDEIAAEGWATGQGGTLTPLTAGRLHGFAERLIEAYVRHAPYRTEVKGPEEYWLVDGVKHWYSWMAVAKAGFIPEDEIRRAFATAYVTAFSVHGQEPDLEKVYSAATSQRPNREMRAPFLVMYIDHEMRQATHGSATLDALVPRLFRGRRAESLWSALPAVKPGFWEDLRARYVRGSEVAPAQQFHALAPARTAPDPPAGAPVAHLTLVYTGETHAYLENCGCKTNQSGGVARRATVVERIRRRHPDALVLDAGEAFARPKTQAELDFLSRQEQSLYLRTLDLMRYDAVSVGSSELHFGLEHFHDSTRGLATPYLSANVRRDGRPVAPASRILRSGGRRVAVIGVLEPPYGREADARFEESALRLDIEDPVEALRREAAALGSRADLIIAMGRLTPFTVRRIAQTVPEVDVILSSEFAAPVEPEGHADGGGLHRNDDEGFVGRALVLYTHLTNYGLSSARLGIDAEGRVASADLDDTWLDETVPDHPRVRDILNRFYDQVGRQAAAQESVQPLFADDPERLSGRYVGGKVCAGCHEEEHRQWTFTGHAGAYKTLLDRHRHFQPKCISCHVVGYGTPHGYRLGAPEQTLANVQCEVCHGPGAEHAGSPAATNIRRQVPEKVCLECHNPEHSDHFVYAERLPKVRHDFYPEGMGPAATAGGGEAARGEEPARGGEPAGGAR
jgi:hypothetical protein